MRSVLGRRTAALGAVGAAALFAAACGQAPDENGDGGDEAVEKDFKACMVTDTGGPDDKSFNESAWNGMQAAVDEVPEIEIEILESKEETDYEPNLNQLASGDCDYVLAVGGLMSEALGKVAPEYPDTRFGIVDSSVAEDNVFSMEFNTAENSFLAGYLAAGMSETGKVATYGGMDIPPVTIFMDGFAEGVAHYNEANDDEVEVLGWDAESHSGAIVGGFTAPDEGASQTETFISQGADVIFPVAGGTGVGTPTVTSEEEGVYTIWVDADGCQTTEYCDQYLTSVMKDIAGAVRDSLIEARDGGPSDGRSVGNLANGGVKLSDYHDDVPEELAAELVEVEQAIVDGEVEIVSDAQPAPAE